MCQLQGDCRALCTPAVAVHGTWCICTKSVRLSSISGCLLHTPLSLSLSLHCRILEGVESAQSLPRAEPREHLYHPTNALALVQRYHREWNQRVGELVYRDNSHGVCGCVWVCMRVWVWVCAVTVLTHYLPLSLHLPQTSCRPSPSTSTSSPPTRTTKEQSLPSSDSRTPTCCQHTTSHSLRWPGCRP